MLMYNLPNLKFRGGLYELSDTAFSFQQIPKPLPTTLNFKHHNHLFFQKGISEGATGLSLKLPWYFYLQYVHQNRKPIPDTLFLHHQVCFPESNSIEWRIYCIIPFRLAWNLLCWSWRQIMFLPFHESLPSLAGIPKQLFASLLIYAPFL